MLFFHPRTRNTAISARSMHDGTYTNKVRHTCIVCGCISILTGVILIVIGVISDIKKNIFIGVGIIILGVVFFLTTIVCYYANLDICYNNWAYRSRVAAISTETPPPAPTYTVSSSPFVRSPTMTQRSQCTISLEPPIPITILSDAEIHNHR